MRVIRSFPGVEQGSRALQVTGQERATPTRSSQLPVLQFLLVWSLSYQCLWVGQTSLFQRLPEGTCFRFLNVFSRSACQMFVMAMCLSGMERPRGRRHTREVPWYVQSTAKARRHCASRLMGRLAGPARLLAMNWQQATFDAEDGTVKLLRRLASCGSDLPTAFLLSEECSREHWQLSCKGDLGSRGV